jgi:hypothetical protein
VEDSNPAANIPSGMNSLSGDSFHAGLNQELTELAALLARINAEPERTNVGRFC